MYLIQCAQIIAIRLRRAERSVVEKHLRVGMYITRYCLSLEIYKHCVLLTVPVSPVHKNKPYRNVTRPNKN